ncbi:hypothetical protein AAVH_30548 [Aphelenchoides avenae]|nr:hypothetical protein AAVH_30548 [Aphelenchus avenae]
MLDLEEKEVAGYDEPLIYPVLDVGDDDFESKVLNLMEENNDRETWANVAYFPRRSTTAVFIRDGDVVTVTNDPNKAAECQNPDRRR